MDTSVIIVYGVESYVNCLGIACQVSLNVLYKEVRQEGAFSARADVLCKWSTIPIYFHFNLPSASYAHICFLFAYPRLLNMESAESQVSLDPPEQLIPQHQNNIQESETDKRLRVLLEAHRDNGHLQSFLEAYQHDEDLRDLLEAIQSDEDLVALVKAYRENKHIRTIIHHQPASEPIDDYITEFETRCQLFAKFQECTDSTNFLARKRALNATVFAIVMVAPIAILQTTLSSPKNRDKWLINYFGMVQDRAAEVVKYYKPGCQVTIQWVLEGFLRRPIVIPSQAENSLAANKVLHCLYILRIAPFANVFIVPSSR